MARLLTKTLKAPTPAPTKSPLNITNEEEGSDIDSISDSSENNDKDGEEEKKVKEKEDVKAVETKKPIPAEITEEGLHNMMKWT